jgi:hypothetical protein
MKYFLLLFFASFFYSSDQSSYYRKNLIDDIYLLIPNTKIISKDSTYFNIKIYKGKTLIFSDTSNIQYLIENEFWPFSRKLSGENYEILIKVFDAPDYDKIHGLYISDGKLKEIKVFPDFSSDLKQHSNDINSILSGYMHIAESPCENCDSCYYNPKLCFKFGTDGIYLDSALTIKENEKRWGGFYGFHLTEKIVLPCKHRK